MPNLRANRRLIMRRRSASSLDAATTAWVNAVVGAGGSVSATLQGYVDTLIKAYKSASVWSVLDREWLYASENATQASIDIVSLSTHTLVSSPTFSANVGYVFTGSEYINTNYTTGSNFTTNGNSFGAYVRQPVASFSNGSILGVSGLYSYLQAKFANIEFDANEAQFFLVANPSGFSAGNFIVTRTNATDVSLYRNLGAALSTQTGAPAGLPSVNFFVGAMNNAGSPASNFGGTIASAFMGGALNSTLAQAKNTALNAYMTSISNNVY